MDLQYTIPEAFFDDPAHGLARLKLPAATRCGSFRLCGTRRICPVDSPADVVKAMLL